MGILMKTEHLLYEGMDRFEARKKIIEDLKRAKSYLDKNRKTCIKNS